MLKRGASSRALSVQVSSERGADSGGFVATFDDITDLVSAQRTAAWADVARRIAHEIKNPLTPIQLSAERLKRKYAKEVTTDPDVLCAVHRHHYPPGGRYRSHGSMSSPRSPRMPTPVMRRENAQELIHQAIFLQRVAHPNIAFETRLPKDPVYLECDGRLISQALTNVLKNAGESVEASAAKGEDGTAGRITISLEQGRASTAIRIADQRRRAAAGTSQSPDRTLCHHARQRHRPRLAIVRKIMEDHGGEIALKDAEDDQGGAQVILTFPPRPAKRRKQE